MKYKGFEIREEERVDPALHVYTVYAIYQGDKRLEICDNNAARHVIDEKLKAGVWQNKMGEWKV